ncbi:MAG: right-handed parallel beta-helix repeat-containing protein [Actinomycetota bacterium]|nr:right-handed parallel beta-helix repeat-containing protein [Actinomycetota bacterium]
MRFRKTVGLASAAALALGGMVLLGEPVGANHVSCGAVITQSITLDSNLSNCPGDGLRIAASNIVVDLGGRTISGRTDTNTSPNEFVGIRLMNVTGVTVRNGTVTNFDAGVAIGRGGGNTITRIRAVRNINHSTLTGTINECNFGDGIVANDSDNNTISGNTAQGNGPYGGITLVGDSDGNQVVSNLTVQQNVDNAHPNFVNQDRPNGNGPCGPFVPTAGTVGAIRQGVGIRVEGPGADNNRVIGNHSSNNDAFGITIHGYICHPAEGTQQQVQPNNGGNVISRNNVVANGFNAQLGGAPTQGDGIAIPAQGPDIVVCTAHSNSVTGNSVTSNARHGIALGHRGPLNTNISGNIVRNNGVARPGDGINLGGPGGPNSRCGEVLTTPCPGAQNNTLRANTGSGNSEHDAHDGNPNCDNNNWENNNFGTVFRGCENT